MSKKKLTIQEKVAIISAIGIVSAALISQSPTWYQAWEERPKVDISFGQMTDLPKKELPITAGVYQIELNARNRGMHEGNILVTVQGVNTRVSFNQQDKYWKETVTQRFFVYADPSYRSTPVYILPNYADTNEFTIEFTIQEDNNRHFFQEARMLIPTKLTYTKDGNVFRLTNQN